ncbi:unnamed protein product [Phyllotreta striolata]|uniref:Fatty acyl-CoA reductase n=1 Tax=Phyllotreta striolata TaxID=444603 RepID=A0A9N9TV24_PHYSR|nr:unnamed protein product [Phyllotreta striolata]
MEFIENDPLLLGDHEPKNLDSTDPENLTPVQEFYRGASVLITGATGFLGKILLEKLLRSCGEVSTVYLLVRNKKGKAVATRVDEIFDEVVFERLKKECPKFRHKVVGVAGDCSLPDLGLSLEDRKRLIENVTIVFHVAATVRFDEKLKTAIDINVRATQDMLRLAREMPKLKSYIHVSTAYSNCVEPVIEERIYPPAMDYKKLLVMSDTLSDKLLDNLVPTILEKYPNTYAFTKQIAESVVQDLGKSLPVGITRPSIVVSTVKEPVRAWINNMYGATGVVAGSGVGLLRTLHCDKNSNANIVPVDMCVNSMIAAAWDVNEQFFDAVINEKDFDIPIYNFESSNDCPITWEYFMNTSLKYGFSIPSAKAIWYFCLILEKNLLLYTLYTFFLHTVPALLVDGALLCIGKKPKMMKVYSKVNKFSKVLSYFALKNWTFKSYNVQRVCRKMSDRDNRIFFSDLRQLNWDMFFQAYLRGVRVFLINDPMDTLPAANVKWRRLYWAHQTTKVVLAYFVLRFLWTCVSFFFNFL